ncbi:DUF6510 family protein [Curtobacterium sp. MCLR17_007]|uniref:DUF6510 family protein n=1 Tax=unclassified Curtobacterium TaxID=257496 RepID=UPI0006FEA766|nr:DUF6510 family protein [Curtobacterium sp. MCLR17_007]KQS07928.1 hypothetical protein ASG04_12230 [Curtobacterium sp. Leaf183]WIB58601.1 DUF6510 family protein [Curtobacterium sp. MCLR17_007]
MTVLDGNALAGVLSEVLGPDATVARLRCTGCGELGALGETRVYRTAMGAVARCHGCDAVLVTVVTNGPHRWVGMPGVRAAAF